MRAAVRRIHRETRMRKSYCPYRGIARTCTMEVMKLFLDTANTAYVKEIAEWGVLDGVTTNPSLVLKEGGDGSSRSPQAFKKTVLEMCKHVPCVSAQVTATDAKGMIKQGEEYAGWHKHVVVKVPMTTEGLKALKHFRSKNIKTNTTLVF